MSSHGFQNTNGPASGGHRRNYSDGTSVPSGSRQDDQFVLCITQMRALMAEQNVTAEEVLNFARKEAIITCKDEDVPNILTLLNEKSSQPSQRPLDGCWFVEYEIPPLRAIYGAEADLAYTEEEIRASIARLEPLWRIRKIKHAARRGYEPLHFAHAALDEDDPKFAATPTVEKDKESAPGTVTVFAWIDCPSAPGWWLRDSRYELNIRGEARVTHDRCPKLAAVEVWSGSTESRWWRHPSSRENGHAHTQQHIWWSGPYPNEQAADAARQTFLTHEIEKTMNSLRKAVSDPDRLAAWITTPNPRYALHPPNQPAIERTPQDLIESGEHDPLLESIRFGHDIFAS